MEPESRFSNTLGPKRAGGLWVTALAVDGTVCLGFASKTDDSPEAATKLLQNEAFCHGLRLVGEFGLLGLLQQTVTRRLGHFLCYECVWLPGKRFTLKLLQDHSPTLKAIAHWVRNSSSVPIKMHSTDAKMQKIEPDPNFFMMDESFGGSV